MSSTARIALTFLLAVLAVLLWGASQFPAWYDRDYIGGVERIMAVFLFTVALALNLLERPLAPRRTLPAPRAMAPRRVASGKRH